METERKEFEAAMWAYYVGLKAKGWSAPEEGERVPPALFWREESGKYGVLSVEAAWNGWQMARKSVVPGVSPELIRGWQRYEKARKLNLRQWAELHALNLEGAIFDDMIDALPDAGTPLPQSAQPVAWRHRLATETDNWVYRDTSFGKLNAEFVSEPLYAAAQFLSQRRR